MLHYITTLNLIRLTIKHKKNSIKILCNKKNKRVLLILIKLNIVFGWTNIICNTEKYYNVYVNNFFYKKIVTIIKPSKQISIKFNQIKKYKYKINNSSIFLTTSKGIISISDAVDFKCGGVLLFCLL